MEFHGFLNVDKPLGWTSHDVVGRLRRILKTRRIGHAGTLDPAATGVLVVGVGRSTRFLDYVQSDSKEYLAHVVLGVESETADIDGRIAGDATPVSSSEPSIEQIVDSLSQFTGEIGQIPPKYSAVKQGGEPLYRRMRRGENVEVPVRSVRVDAISVLEYRYPDLVLEVECGPGVYIRSLARDIGEHFGTNAYLHHLVRTRVGAFHLTTSSSISAFTKSPFPEQWTSVAHAIDLGISSSRAAMLEGDAVTSWYHGRSINVRILAPIESQPIRAFTSHGTFAGIGTVTSVCDSEHLLRPRVVLAST
jgi:tRNA pseudouridine55 synthase